MYGYRETRWDGYRLRLSTGRILATIEPDRDWVGMFRVRLPDGRLTDMTNLTRAKDAAVSLALSTLNNPDRKVA